MQMYKESLNIHYIASYSEPNNFYFVIDFSNKSFIIGKTKCERYKKRNAIIRV